MEAVENNFWEESQRRFEQIIPMIYPQFSMEKREGVYADDHVNALWLVWTNAQPQWKLGEWQEDFTVLRKYALDGERKVWVIDLPPLTG